MLIRDTDQSNGRADRGLLARVRHGRMGELLQNITASYGFYFSGYLLSFLLIPYLARVLGPARWGSFALVQALGYYLILIEEYGFAFSGTRAVAKNREDPAHLSAILAGITGAKCFLALAAFTAAIGASALLPQLRTDPRLFWWGVVWAILQGGNLNWYYQGLERMRIAASVDISIKFAATIVTIFLVKVPGDAWKAFALAAAACLASLITLTFLAYRKLPFRLPRRNIVFANLKAGFGLFFPRNSLVLSSMSGVFIISMFASPVVVGEYAGAERVCRAMIGLLIPMTDALYSRLNRIVAQSPASFNRSATLVLMTMTALGALIGVVMFVSAPWLIQVILGRQFQSATVILRILAVMTPFVALGNTLGAHWLLTLGLDRELSYLSLAAVVATIFSGVVLAPYLGNIGVALALVISQVLLTAAAYWVVRVRLRGNGRAADLLAQPRCALEPASGD